MAARLPGSFRDPAGHVYVSDGILYRRIEPAGRDAYQRLMESGLYDGARRRGPPGSARRPWPAARSARRMDGHPARARADGLVSLRVVLLAAARRGAG